MAKFHKLYHGNCTLKSVRGFLDPKKLDYRGLKGQIDVKKANFRGEMAKIGHYRHILATKTHLRSIFMEYVMEIGL